MNRPSIADQSVEQLGGPGSLLARQRLDHERLDELLEVISTTTGDAQDDALTELCRLAFPHAFAEEAVAWLALRRALPDGEELIARATELLREDVRVEEDELFPRLQDALDQRELRRLGTASADIRRIASKPSPPCRRAPTTGHRPVGPADV